MPSQPLSADGLSSSPISSPPDSIFQPDNGSFQGEDGKDPAAASPKKDSGSPTIMEQLQGMEKAKLEGDSSPPAEAKPEIRVAADKKRAAKPVARNTKRSPPAKKAKTSKQWDPQFLLEDHKSPLAKVDIRALLSHPRAWSVLSPEERREVLAKFPDDEFVLRPGTDEAAPDIQALRNNNNFRHDAARYAENLARGFHDPEWVREAWTAHEKRAAGEFDAFRVRKFEDDWEVELPEAMKPPLARRDEGSPGAGAGPEGAAPGERASGPGASAAAERSEQSAAPGKADEEGQAGDALVADEITVKFPW